VIAALGIIHGTLLGGLQGSLGPDHRWPSRLPADADLRFAWCPS